ncbi:MAG: hypothetical protein DRG76_05170 [Deltaproteobacteria bacterium]|nr:MAG: hypothetical protein DRG76_05170 [Deltaproteobacteria bacterium]
MASPNTVNSGLIGCLCSCNGATAFWFTASIIDGKEPHLKVGQKKHMAWTIEYKTGKMFSGIAVQNKSIL